ncbi:MAG: PQQ-binding-like beta-propeller repeat protein [Candidatus Helarchaeota archaeon]|nr:PQQ-binding-like beta-propeller repeat protein [Candidatus Helarchaeota archaeon]
MKLNRKLGRKRKRISLKRYKFVLILEFFLFFFILLLALWLLPLPIQPQADQEIQDPRNEIHSAMDPISKWNYTTGGNIISVAISANGQYIVAGSADNKAYLFDRTNSTPIWNYTTGGDVNSVAISANGSYIAIGSADNNVYLFNRTNLIWNSNTGYFVDAVGISADGFYIVAGTSASSGPPQLFLYDITSSVQIWDADPGMANNGDTYSVAIAADGSYIVWSVRADAPLIGDVYAHVLYDRDGGGSAEWFYAPSLPSKTVAISADGFYSVGGSDNNDVYLLDKTSNSPIWNYPTGGDVKSVAISADGSYIVAGSADNEVYLFNGTNSTPIGSFSTGALVNTVSISALGYNFVAGSGPTVMAIESPIPPQNAPVLDPIPSPDFDGIIQLNWNDVIGATTYYIYRNTSDIPSVSGMTPIVTVSESSYIDTLTTNGTYYYVIVAGNVVGNSSISNCENVTVELPLSAPVLDPIVPAVDGDGIIDLNWSDVVGATTYYVFRDISNITSVVGLTPIIAVSESNYTDTLMTKDLLLRDHCRNGWRK